MKEFGYSEISEPVELNGIVIKRDLMIYIDEIAYRLSVATQSYLDQLRDYNSRIADEDMKLDDNILHMDSVNDLSEVVANLLKTPPEEITRYMVMQEPLKT